MAVVTPSASPAYLPLQVTAGCEGGPRPDFGGGSESTNGWNRKKEESSDFGCEGRNLQGSSGRKEGEKNPGIACEIGKWGGRGC